MQNKYTYFVTDRRGTREVVPAGEFNLKFAYERAKDGRIDYQLKLTGDLSFKNEHFKYLLELERSQYRDENLVLQLRDLDKITVIYTCRLNFSDGDWFIDNCILKISAQALDAYEQYDDLKGNVFNLLSVATPRISVYLLEDGVTFEGIDFENTAQCDFDPLWSAGGDPYALGWVPVINDYRRVVSGGLTTCDKYTQWLREVKTVDCLSVMPAPWIFISEVCPGAGRKYARTPIRYKTVTIDNAANIGPDNVYTKRDEWGIFGYTTPAPAIDNGVLLADLMQALCATIGITCKSEFYQIDPDVITDINYVTGAASTTNKIVIWQKSDVKRPTVLNNAVKAELTFEKQLDSLVKLHNCGWRISGGVMRIEHISYFTKNTGLDLRIVRYLRELNFKKEYTYEKNKLYNKETFKFMDLSPFPSDFYTAVIYYRSNNTQPGTEGEKDRGVDDITTDLVLCLQNSDSESKIVSDEGFFYGSCYFLVDKYYFNEAAAIDEPEIRPNNVFGWTHLIKDFFYYNRPFLHGDLNSDHLTFLTVEPCKKGATLSIPLCKGDTFDPLDKILTPFGWGAGIVGSAEFVPHSRQLTLSLLYDQEFNLVPNTKPTAIDDTAVTSINAEVIIDVLANDFDDQGFDTIQGLVIYGLGPSSGRLEIQPDHKIKYIPNPGYSGNDQFQYAIKDYWGELSNYATVFITITGAVGLPVAFGDTYRTQINTLLHVNAPGILVNDVDDQPGLFITAGTFATNQGGSITLFADGSFEYTPPVDYYGPDFYDYTLNDSDANTAIGRINILVAAPFFVKLITGGVTNVGNAANICESNPDGHRFIENEYTIFSLKFFADAAGLIPINVTGFGVTVTIHFHQQTAGFPDFDYNTPYLVGGTEFIPFPDLGFITYFFDQGCGGSGAINQTTALNLIPGAGYTII